MAPRRGGAGGAGAEAVGGGSGRNYFEPPPLKRMSPWVQDGADQCDVLAGGVDDSGLFKGVYVSGVHLMALMRTFQLSKVFMPCDTPTPVGWIGQSLQDGIPITIVTRGCFGRELDFGPGPCRNDVQRTIWQMARDMRAEMPQVLITCIDVPNNLGSDMLQAVLESPLNEFRELMYHDGKWYTPTVVNGAQLGKWMAENARARPPEKGKARMSQFNRKKFEWQDSAQHYSNMWILSWRVVLEVRGAPDVPRRTDLKFTVEAQKPELGHVKLPPSAAEAAFKRALSKARDEGDGQAILAATTAYLDKASMKETESLQEATKACDEASDLFKAKAEAKAAMDATSMKFKALVSMGKIEEAMKVAEEALASATEPELKAKALKLVVTCHQTAGDLDKAIEVASAGKADISKLGNEDASCEALTLLVTACVAKGDYDGGAAAATEAATGGGKFEACTNSLLAMAKLAKSAEEEVPATSKALAREAAAALHKAAGIYQGQRLAKEAADTLKETAEALMKAAEFAEAATVAKELKEAAKDDKALEATSDMLVAKALLGSNAATPGGTEEMLSSAKTALALAEESGSAEVKAACMEVLAQVLLAENTLDESYRMAKSAAAGYKALKKTESMCHSLLLAAKAAVKSGNLNSAAWDAKQIVSEGTDGIYYPEAVTLVGQVSREAEASGKPVGVGGLVPVVSGDALTFV